MQKLNFRSYWHIFFLIKIWLKWLSKSYTHQKINEILNTQNNINQIFLSSFISSAFSSALILKKKCKCLKEKPINFNARHVNDDNMDQSSFDSLSFSFLWMHLPDEKFLKKHLSIILRLVFAFFNSFCQHSSKRHSATDAYFTSRNSHSN